MSENAPESAGRDTGTEPPDSPESSRETPEDVTPSSGEFWDDTWWLLSHIGPYTWIFVGLLLLSVGSSAFQQGRLALMQPLMDRGILGDETQEMPQFLGVLQPLLESIAGEVGPRMTYIIASILAVLILSLLAAVTLFFQKYVARLIRENIMVDIRTRLFSHLLAMPIGFYDITEKGDLISRVTNDIKVTQKAITRILTILFKEPFMALGGLAIAFWASWRLALLSLLVIPLVVIPFKYFGDRIKNQKELSLDTLGGVVESIHQALSGLRIVKIFQGQEREKEAFLTKNHELKEKNLEVIKNKAMSKSFLELFQGVLICGFFLVGAYLVIQEFITLGSLVTFIIALAASYDPIRRSVKGYNHLMESLAGVKRLRHLFAQPAAREETGEGTRKIDSLQEGISLKNITFAYEEEPVLKHIHMDLNAGDVVALVGPSGAGKSTLMDIVAQFYVPDSGEITVDGIPLFDIDRSSYRDLIAIVNQDAFLFNTTIEENIRYGRPNATREDVIDAAKAAHIHDFITSLPEKYKTNVGERGVRVSGGEKQRITVARALLKNADLLLLDEATSELDSRSEEKIQSALNTLLKNRTCLVIAHRLSTVQNADCILVMNEGEIVQKGTHEELLEKGGLYRELHRLQFDNGS